MTLQLSRLGLYFLLLVFTIIYQVRYPLFINSDFLIPLYVFVCLALSVTTVFLFLGKRAESIQKNALKILLPIDAFVITAIVYKTGLQNTLYLFFYLYLIFITSLSFQLKGALYYSILCSVLLCTVLLLDGQTDVNSKIFLFLVNNVAFFVVAYLSGNLSGQLLVLGEEVKVKEKNIRELKNINSVIIENMKTGLILLDMKLNVTQYNPASLEILGITEKKNFYHFLQEVSAFDKKMKNDKVKVWNSEIQYVVNDDNKRTLEILISELNVPGEQLGYLVLFQDITEKKRMFEKMKNQEKLAAVGQLAAGIAHEIRNPLASMSGSVQLLATSFEKIDDEQKKLIAITLKETDRLNLLISEFLEFVRPNLPLDDNINLIKLIEDTVEIVKLNNQIQIPPIEFKKNEIPEFRGNRDKLKQVFMNILINAAQAKATLIQVEAEIKGEGQKKEIHVSIKDNGQGMKEEVRKKAFEPFYTTKPRGTGLGLAIVHKIIESHNGSIAIESELQKGTQFLITLPLV